jgi:hypothetical protein
MSQSVLAIAAAILVAASVSGGADPARLVARVRDPRATRARWIEWPGAD